MCSLKSFAVICLLFSATIASNVTQESIGFPEPEEDPNLVNKDNRQPVYLPSVCPETELFYPGDQKDDWICDCRPAFLYHPKTDRCWPAYRRGPCQDREYLVLKADSAIPVCETNPCSIDSYVYYNGRCEQLTTPTACRHMWPIPAALAVDAATLTVTCERINLQSRFGKNRPVAVATNQTCPPGCKRSINANCVPVSG